MRHLLRDVQYAWRGLTRAPLFTIVALMSIALGIGANTAIFTLVDEVLLRVLPVKNPEQLVLFSGARNHYGSNSGGNMLSFPMYEDFRDNFVDQGKLPRVSAPVDNAAPHPPIFSGMFARRTSAMNVGIEGQTERVPGEIVTGTYFQVLGVGAAIGRVITPDDDKVRGVIEEVKMPAFSGTSAYTREPLDEQSAVRRHCQRPAHDRRRRGAALHGRANCRLHSRASCDSRQPSARAQIRIRSNRGARMVRQAHHERSS
jgi:hypothetical protein